MKNDHPSLVDIMNYYLGKEYKENIALHLKKCKFCLKQIRELEEKILKNKQEKEDYPFYKDS